VPSFGLCFDGFHLYPKQMRLGMAEGCEEFPPLTLAAFLKLHLTLKRRMHLMLRWDVARQRELLLS